MRSSDGSDTSRRQFLKTAVLSSMGVAAAGMRSTPAAASTSAKPLVLVRQGKSNYSIVISGTASPSEKRASGELQGFIEQITGARLPIVTGGQESRRETILLGDSGTLRKLGLHIPFDKLGAEGFVLRTEGPRLIIAGGKQRGTLYGVYALLDKLGCRWFTPEVSVIPKRPTLLINRLNETQKPAFEYREPYFTEAADKDWAARNRVNGSFQRLDESTGGKISYFPFVHSFYSILPPTQYSHDHPEYYALVDGTRRDENAQLCLTNSDVLRLTIQTVLRWIDEHPEASIFSVSQNDTQGWCECESCRRVEQEEGGAHSGPILRFVNAVATEVGKTHPDKLIDTLAYWYSEPPPLHVRPVPNVRIRLCPIGACEAHAYDRCEHDRYFLNHLREWAKITDQLYIWHYVTNFAHYLLPFPDFDELAADIPLYKRNGVAGIFLEGDACPGGGGENAELRSYVMVRLLWNPNTDVDETVNEFMAAYYGQASKVMRAYFDLQHRQVRLAPQGTGHHMWIYDHPGAPYLSQNFIGQATNLLEEAESAAADDVTRRRVQRARLSIDYVKLIHSKAFVVRDGIYAPENLDQLSEKFQKILSDARSFGITALHEGVMLEETEKLFASHIKPYRVVTLENASLRVIVAPDLRGRIISIINKSTNTDVVHHPDPGERTYPDVSGVAVYACADYVQARTYDVTWQLDGEPRQQEVHLMGTSPEGLKMRRIIRLAADKPAVYTETTVENTGSAAIDAVLSARFEIAPKEIDKAAIAFRNQSGTPVQKPVLTPGQEPSGSQWYAGSEQPDGEWAVNEAAAHIAAVNTFPTEQVARCNANWTGKADSRVTLSLWSAKRNLAPGETLRLDTDYEIRRS